VSKYRKKLVLSYGEEVKKIFEEIALKSDCSFETLEVDQDHIHCLVKSEPHLSPLSVVRRLKQGSTIRLWGNHEHALQRQFWKERTFWSDGYFAVRLAMPVKPLFASILNNKAEGGQFIHEAEDSLVFLPVFYKHHEDHHE